MTAATSSRLASMARTMAKRPARRAANASPSRTKDKTSNGLASLEDDDYTPSDGALTESKPKRRKTTNAKSANGTTLSQVLLSPEISNDGPAQHSCVPPLRKHATQYHRPRILHGDLGKEARSSLLRWFDSVSTDRSMPWRKAWIDPKTVCDTEELRRQHERRAYEVWISEIMLQQTRVAVVIDYWRRWMEKWPTIQDLAKADPEDVLAAWRGLGYYSRATRIHEASKLVVNDEDMCGKLPETAQELDARIPGVGRYTAGAISAIVYGHSAPMVDGNVLRVLSRQLGVYGDVKSDKTVIDALWATADALAHAIARDGSSEGDSEPQPSDRPGRWGQGLMELGSTICTPKPNCSACPVTWTCRAFEEGMALASKKTQQGHVDIEDLCTICSPFDDDGAGDVEATVTPDKEPTRAKTTKSKAQMSLASFAFTRSSKQPAQESKGKESSSTDSQPLSATTFETIANHAKKFPLKQVKKAVRQEETIVCAIRRGNSDYLIQRRPEKGLLAGLWEFPSYILDPNTKTSAKKRRDLACAHVNKVLAELGHPEENLVHVDDLGSIPWLFSHLKLTMHVHYFSLEEAVPADGSNGDENGVPRRWTSDVENESMGTGMRKCWSMVRDAAEE